MRTKFFLPLLAAFAAFTLASCAKEEPTPDDPNSGGGTTVNNTDFRWTINGVTTVADSAVCYAQFTTLFAYRSGTITTVEINLADIVPATYKISSTTGNELKYQSSNANLAATSGTVVISSSTGNKLSGTFDAKFNNSSISTISGQFSNVKLR